MHLKTECLKKNPTWNFFFVETWMNVVRVTSIEMFFLHAVSVLIFVYLLPRLPKKWSYRIPVVTLECVQLLRGNRTIFFTALMYDERTFEKQCKFYRRLFICKLETNNSAVEWNMYSVFGSTEINNLSRESVKTWKVTGHFCFVIGIITNHLWWANQ